VIPENIRKKQARDAKLLKERQDKRAKDKAERVGKRKQFLASAEKYHREYLDTERSLIDAKRQAKAASSFFVEADPKIAFVIRIKGINKLSPQCKKIMQLLRLRQLHNGVFVRLNKATINMIRKVEPFIAYGYPSRKTIHDLIYKRGFGKINGQRIPLTDNSIVENSLGSLGIFSVEDLVHEIVTFGPNFKKANNFLWPFKLNSPKKGFELKRHPYQNGGAFGNREEQINELVHRML